MNTEYSEAVDDIMAENGIGQLARNYGLCKRLMMLFAGRTTHAPVQYGPRHYDTTGTGRILGTLTAWRICEYYMWDEEWLDGLAAACVHDDDELTLSNYNLPAGADLVGRYMTQDWYGPNDEEPLILAGQQITRHQARWVERDGMTQEVLDRSRVSLPSMVVDELVGRIAQRDLYIEADNEDLGVLVTREGRAITHYEAYGLIKAGYRDCWLALVSSAPPAEAATVGKIEIIKQVRARTGCGLKEAKETVDWLIESGLLEAADQNNAYRFVIHS